MKINLEILSRFDIARVSRMRHRNWRNIYCEDLLPKKILKSPQLFSKRKSVAEYLGKLKQQSRVPKIHGPAQTSDSFNPMNTRDILCSIS